MNIKALTRTLDDTCLKRGNVAENFPATVLLNLTLSFQANLNGSNDITKSDL